MKIKLFTLLLLICMTSTVCAQNKITRKPTTQQAKPKPTPAKPASKPQQRQSKPAPRINTSPVSNQTFTVNGVSFTMIGVQGGTFMMGATSEQKEPDSDEKPVHQVTLSSYAIGETEVTQALWTAVMGNTIEQITKAIGWNTYGVGDNYPMYSVSWNDCQQFITKLNSLTGRKFRLPTEAEWEYAARGGNKSKGYQYSGSNNISDVAWYDGNSSSTAHPVKTKQPNELGIYDMTGNVWEWCQDWEGSYTSNSQTNPTGPNTGLFRVDRGGSWNYLTWYCRSARRNYDMPSACGSTLGLRLCLSE